MASSREPTPPRSSYAPRSTAAPPRRRRTSAARARFLAHLLEDVRESRGSGVADGVQRALDRPARSFEDFAKRAASEGAWSS